MSDDREGLLFSHSAHRAMFEYNLLTSLQLLLHSPRANVELALVFNGFIHSQYVSLGLKTRSIEA